MELETMEPDPEWDPAGHEETLEVLRSNADGLTVRVWGGDWCGDCRRQLPAFAAALRAAGIDPASVEQYPVEKENGGKVGPGMAEYGVEFIPTVVVERDGEEVARFVEEGPVPIAEHLAARLEGAEATARN